MVCIPDEVCSEGEEGKLNKFPFCLDKRIVIELAAEHIENNLYALFSYLVKNFA